MAAARLQIVMPRPLGGIKQWHCLTSDDVCRVHREYSRHPQLLEAKRAGRRRPGVRRVWAGAGPQRQRTRAGNIVAASCLQLVSITIIMPRPLIGGGIKRCFCLTSVWRLSVAYIGPKSRTERPRKTKIGTEVAHVTRDDSDTTFKVKRSRLRSRPLYSAQPWRVRQLQQSAWERIGVGNYSHVAVCSAALGASAPTEGGEGRGHTVAAARLQLVNSVLGISSEVSAYCLSSCHNLL